MGYVLLLLVFVIVVLLVAFGTGTPSVEQQRVKLAKIKYSHSHLPVFQEQDVQVSRELFAFTMKCEVSEVEQVYVRRYLEQAKKEGVVDEEGMMARIAASVSKLRNEATAQGLQFTIPPTSTQAALAMSWLCVYQWQLAAGLVSI